MSRSYKKKLRLHVCYGNNTEYYRSRRRRNRRSNNNLLRTVIANFTLDEVDDNLMLVNIPKRDIWNEPTDGTSVKDVDSINKEIIDSGYDRDTINWYRKICRKLKHRNKILGI